MHPEKVNQTRLDCRKEKWIAGDVATEGWVQIPAATTIPPDPYLYKVSLAFSEQFGETVKTQSKNICPFWAKPLIV